MKRDDNYYVGEQHFILNGKMNGRFNVFHNDTEGFEGYWWHTVEHPQELGVIQAKRGPWPTSEGAYLSATEGAEQTDREFRKLTSKDRALLSVILGLQESKLPIDDEKLRRLKNSPEEVTHAEIIRDLLDDKEYPDDVMIYLMDVVASCDAFLHVLTIKQFGEKNQPLLDYYSHL